MKISVLDMRKKEFLDWTIEQDNNKHNNASDAELEEMYGTERENYESR